MAENAADWKTVLGEAFKIEDNDDKGLTKFTVKSYTSGAYINCTLWHNSHGHWVGTLKNGDAVIVNGKYTTPPKKDGDGHWKNLSVSSLGKLAEMDRGIDTRNQSDEGDADTPDVL